MLTNTDRKLRVFLCHASQDKPIVRELYQRLLSEGWIDPWLDEEKLRPGQNFDMEIEKAVESADAVVVCLSTNSVNKVGYIQKELRKVLDMADRKPEGTAFIIPIRLDECVIPRKMQSLHYVDYFPVEKQEVSLQKLLESLKPPFDQYNQEMEWLESDLKYANEVLTQQLDEIIKMRNEMRNRSDDGSKNENE